MDHEERAALPVAAEGRAVRRRLVGVSLSVVRAVLARTAAGESLRAIGADPAMPTSRTVCRWAKAKPAFAARMMAARAAAGTPLRPGGRSAYCPETAQAILARMWAGEALTAICRDPAMPVCATVYAWRDGEPEFARAFAVAFEIRAEGMFEQGWEIAQGVTPRTARAVEVQLRQLRWQVGRMAPKKYGPLKAADPARAPSVLNVWSKQYVLPTAEEAAAGGQGRWSEAPSEHLYSMVPVDDPSPMAGMRLPAPEVAAEPASCRGEGATFEARGGAIEAEAEVDYWGGQP